MSKNESEINFDNPILKNARFCRKIVPDGSPIIDPAWREKIDWEEEIFDNTGYILSRRRSKVPAGTKVQFELQPGSDMSQYVDTSLIEYKEGGKWVPIHICTREMGNWARVSLTRKPRGWDGIVEGGRAKGMKYIFVRVEDAEEIIGGISEYLKLSQD